MKGKPRKILMTTDTVGGVWVYSLNLCKSLKEYGIQVHLAAMGAWPSLAQQKEVEKMSNVLLYKSDYKLEWMKDPWEDVEQARKWLNSIYHTVQPDIVHLNNYAHIGEDWEAPIITVFHSCVKTWWQAVKGTDAPDQWNQYTQTVENSLEGSDMVVSPTRAILEKAKEIHKFSSASTVVHNGTYLSSTQPERKEEFILCMGRMWDEAKNLSLLSRIAGDLPWPVYVAGDCIDPNTGEECKAENVEFLGKLPPHEVQHWMQRASIFVSPTRYEPFGLAILEAAGNGCALVLSRLETLQEIWGDAAVYFEPEAEVDAQNKILQLLKDQQALEELADKARKKSKEYSASKMGAAYYDLYRKISRKEPKLKSA